VECHRTLAVQLDHLKKDGAEDVQEDLDVEKLLMLLMQGHHTTATDDESALDSVELEYGQMVLVE